MREPIEKAAENEEIRKFVTEEQIKNLILGHELFHFLEEKMRESIHGRRQSLSGNSLAMNTAPR